MADDTTPYSTPEDFLTGDIPLPPYIDPNKVCLDARDEIDSHIGFIYETPLDVTEGGPLSRPARLLIKRISAHLSSGRLIMAADSSGQNEELHNYGIYLVNQAMDALNAISQGKIVLDGATKKDDDEKVATAPLISNLDAVSQVEAFYGMVTNPTWPYVQPPVVLP